MYMLYVVCANIVYTLGQEGQPRGTISAEIISKSLLLD